MFGSVGIVLGIITLIAVLAWTIWNAKHETQQPTYTLMVRIHWRAPEGMSECEYLRGDVRELVRSLNALKGLDERRYGTPWQRAGVVSEVECPRYVLVRDRHGTREDLPYA